MKEKVMAISQGKYHYEEPQIILSTNKLYIEVPEQGEAIASFRVSNSMGTKMKGFCSTDHFNIDFLPVFSGKDNEIEVKAHAGEYSVGECFEGVIHVISNCGEIELPFEVKVCYRQLQEGIQTYQDFVELAKKDFDSAVTLFYHDKFRDVYLKEFDEKRLYQRLTSKNPKKQALEEFLVAHGDKRPIQFMTNRRQVSYDVYQEDIMGEIMLAIDSWGMVGLRLSVDRDFVALDKTFLCQTDFEGQQATVRFKIDAAKVCEGMNRCRIIFENIYQRVEVNVRVHGKREYEERRKHHEKKKQIAELLRNHIRFLMNSSLKGQWVKTLEKYERSLEEEQGALRIIIRGYMSWLGRNQEGMDQFLDSYLPGTAPGSEEAFEKIILYVLGEYVKTKINRDESQRVQLIETIQRYAREGQNHWVFFVLEERLGVFQGNPSAMLSKLDELWGMGEFSPYLHFYRMFLILQDTDLLKSLDGKTIGALRFGLKHDLISEEIAMAMAFLAGRQRKFTPALFSVLKASYERFRSQDLLHAICALLIRNEKMERKYSIWFRLGVESRLRVTELFEYYMYTLEPSEFDEALPVVMTFFQYENHLRDSVKMNFFASIVKNKMKHPQYYDIYQGMMREFMWRKLAERKVSKELAVLYHEFITPEDLRDQVADDFAHVMFRYNIKCANPNMERVLVVQDEISDEKVYTLNNGEAQIGIATPNYRIYFVDHNGHYHLGTIKYNLEKYMEREEYAATCYENGSEYPLLLTYLFFQILQRDEIGTQEALLLHSFIRNHTPGVEYNMRALFSLYEYYKGIGEDELLEEVVKAMDFKYMSKERRAGVLQTMIQHEQYEDGIQALKKYDITDCTKKLILLLTSNIIEQKQGEFEPYLMRLCYFLFQGGVHNKVTLEYLTDYYMGPIEKLHGIYKTAVAHEVELSDGAIERVLGQALFVSDDPAKYEDVFEEYYDYGVNRVLIRAFTGYTAYAYLVGNTRVSKKILGTVQRDSVSEENRVMVLALLKMYSEQDEYSEREKEFIEYHVDRLVAKGYTMSFMRGFLGKVDIPAELAQTATVEAHQSKEKEVYVEFHFAEGKQTFPMRRAIPDTFLFDSIVFEEEEVPYRILLADRETILEEGVLHGPAQTEITGFDSFYQMLNVMGMAAKKDNKVQFSMVSEEYQRKMQMAQNLFEPL